MKSAEEGFERNGFLGDESAWRAAFHKDYSKWIEAYTEVNKVAVAMFTAAKAHRDNDKEIIVSLLMARILSNYQSLLILMERGFIAEVKIVLRSMFEAVFGLVACAKEETFVDKYVATSKKKHSAYLRKLSGIECLKQIQELQQVSLNLSQQTKSDKETHIKEVAKAAGMLDEYNSHYSELCLFGHANLPSLQGTIAYDEKGRATHHLLERSDKDVKDSFFFAMLLMIQVISRFRTTFNLGFDEDGPRIGTLFNSLKVEYVEEHLKQANEGEGG